MTETTQPDHKTYTPPVSRETKLTWSGQDVLCSCDFVVLKKEDRAVAELFYTSYFLRKKSKTPRAITFIFNGGPGAASAYLHVGALGPLRVQFGEHGEASKLPGSLVENKESWLHFSDLVFLDPIGTGFSRVIHPGDSASAEVKNRATEEKSAFFTLTRDLDALAESIERILTKYRRWGAPVYIAGESYGGFRVGKMARQLQERYGIGLAGAFLISPALEFTSLEYTDYNITPWIGVFPSLAASAWWHKGSRKGDKDLQNVLERNEAFTRDHYSRFLVDGARTPELIDTITKELYLDRDVVERYRGRISPFYFFRDLLREDAKVCCFYDASLTSTDPYPDRSFYSGPDLTVATVGIPFTHGINSLFSEHLSFAPDRNYQLFSYDVFNQWKLDAASYSLGREIGASDDLRAGLSLNPSMTVHISHGVFDLVTPYFATKRIVQLSNLSVQDRQRVITKNYLGGHMFYSWKKSRESFFNDARAVFLR